MATLSDLYASLDAHNSKDSDITALKTMIRQAESDALTKDVVPTLGEICDILLQNFRNDVRIVIERKAGKPSVVNISITDRAEQIEQNMNNWSSEKIINKEHHFYVKSRNGVYGVGIYDPVSNTFKLLPGSKISPSTTYSFNRKNSYHEVTKHYCELINGFFVLKREYVFTSPSTASAVVLGRSSNGWTDWKDERGNSLDIIFPREKNDHN